MPPETVPIEPWRSFLSDLDGLLKGPVELRCLGGFVVDRLSGIPRLPALQNDAIAVIGHGDRKAALH